MSITTKTQLRWTFDAAVKQATHDRELQLAELVRGVNVRRVKDGPPRKRLGYDKTTVATFVEGTYAGPPSNVFGGDHLQVRDANGGIYNVEGATGYFRGTDRRAFPRWYQTGNIVDRCHKPISVMNGDNQWNFSLGVISTGAAVIQLTIVNPLTKEVVRETEWFNVDDFDVMAYAVTVAAGVVWLFYVGYGTPTAIRSMKFLTTTSSPVDVAFATAPGSCKSIDAITLTSGAVIVAATQFDTSGGFHVFGHRISILNQTTGAESSGANYIPATPVDTRTPITGSLALFGNGVNGSVYVAYWVPSQTTDDTAELFLHTHDATTLARASVSLGTETQGGLLPDPCLAAVTGYLAANGDRVVLSTIVGDPSGGNVGQHITNKYTYNGITIVGFIGNWTYVASKPFTVGSTVYFITGFDDDRDQRAQRGYFLRDSSGNIISTILDTEGAAMLHAGGLAAPSGDEDPYTYHKYSAHVVPVDVSGTNAFLSLMTEGFTSRAPAPTSVRLSFGDVYHSDLPDVVAGGIPKVVGAADALREITPLLFPHRDMFVSYEGAGPSTHSTNVVTFRYATVKSNGDITFSAARPLQTLTFATHGAPPLELFQVKIPTLTHAVGQTWIALYGSPNNSTAGPFLQHLVLNDPTEEYVELEVFPAGWTDAGEALDTLGAALEPQSAPPARLATLWRDRPWLAGTPDGRLWPGFEHETGRGYRFNSALAVRWGEGTGEVTAICGGGWDFLAVFKQDAVGIITGSGPDGIGIGAYEVQTLSAEKGVALASPRAVGRGPAGVYFQNAADLRPCLVAGGVVTEIHRGVEDYIRDGTGNFVVTSIVHSRSAREMLFYCAGGKILVLDYAHPTGDQPYGQWYLRESAELVATAGAVTVGTSVVHVDAAGTTTFASWTPGLSFDDDDSPILMDMEFGRLPAAGLLGEFDTFEAQLSSTVFGAGSDHTYTLTDSQGTTEVHADVANSVPDVAFMTNLNRTREFRLRIQETSATGEGRQFDGGVMEIGVYKRPQDARRRIG